MVLIEPRGREVGVTLVKGYGNDMDEAHGIMGPKNFNWPLVQGVLNQLLYS